MIDISFIKKIENKYVICIKLTIIMSFFNRKNEESHKFYF
jgi:hypothetical protein